MMKEAAWLPPKKRTQAAQPTAAYINIIHLQVSRSLTFLFKYSLQSVEPRSHDNLPPVPTTPLIDSTSQYSPLDISYPILSTIFVTTFVTVSTATIAAYVPQWPTQPAGPATASIQKDRQILHRGSNADSFSINQFFTHKMHRTVTVLQYQTVANSYNVVGCNSLEESS